MQAYLTTHDLHFGQAKVFTLKREPPSTREYCKFKKRHVAYGALHIEFGLLMHVRSTRLQNVDLAVQCEQTVTLAYMTGYMKWDH